MAAEPELPRAVVQLLADSIRSIEQLELLLLLRASGARRKARELADELKISDTIAESALQELVRAGLVAQSTEQPARFFFAPRDAELSSAVAVLNQEYEANRLPIIMLISQNAIARVRTGVLTMFSDSFGLSGRKKNG